MGLMRIFLSLVENTDLFIYDSTYTEEEYPNFEGWGHSTWQEGVRLSKEAGVKNYAIFHHDPSHDDDFMDNVELDAKKTFANAFVAKEGMEIEFNGTGSGINLENLMTSRDFRIIGLGIANINFVYLMAKGGGYERSSNGTYKNTRG